MLAKSARLGCGFSWKNRFADESSNFNGVSLPNLEWKSKRKQRFRLYTESSINVASPLASPACVIGRRTKRYFEQLFSLCSLAKAMSSFTKIPASALLANAWCTASPLFVCVVKKRLTNTCLENFSDVEDSNIKMLVESTGVCSFIVQKAIKVVSNAAKATVGCNSGFVTREYSKSK